MSSSPTVPPPSGPAPSLRQRVLKAGSWVLIGHVLAQVMRLGSNLVLTRLLEPDAFGLMSVVYLLMIGLALFSDLGITRSVVQSPRGHEPAFLDTAWTVQVLRGLGLAGATLLVALGFALAAAAGWVRPNTTYADARLPWVVASFALVALLQGLESMRIGLARRNMQMQRLTHIELASQALSTVAMVLLAWALHSIWALVVGAWVAGLARTALSHCWLDGQRERWRLEPAALGEILSNGKWIFVASMLGFMAVNGDRVILGGLIETKAFGLYAIAFLLVNTLQVVASMLCNNVAYPAFSEVHRERPGDLPRVIGRFQWAYDGIVVTIASALTVAGPAVIQVLYDQRYQEAGWMLSVLAAGAIGLRSQLVEQCFQAVHKPQYTTLANLVRLVALAVGILAGHALGGLPGAVAGIAISQFANWPMALWFRWRHGALNWRVDALLLPALAGGALLGWLFAFGVSRFWH